MHFTRSNNFLLAVLMLLVIGGMLLTSCSSSRKTAGSATASNDSTEIHWLSLEQAEAAMKKQPKKVWIDVYTDWCGWCKVMDKKTFTNPDVIRYINRHYYAVKLNAETTDSLRFQGASYGLAADGRNNQLAVKLLNGQMAYPTSLIMDENFVHAYSFMGYQSVPQAESILKYFEEDWYQKITWDQHTGRFQPSWKERLTVDTAAGAMH